MSPSNDTTIRRRRGQSVQQRAASRVDRRKDSAGRGFRYRRQVEDLPPIGPKPPGDPPLTAGTTFTQVRTITPLPPDTTTLKSTSTISRSTTSARTTSSSSSRSSSSSSSSPTTTSSVTPPVITSPSASVPNGTPSQSSADSNSTNSAVGAQGGLSSGAIAGIAIAVVVVLAALIAFLVRRRMMANRAERRNDWFDRSGFSAPAPTVMAQSTITPFPGPSSYAPSGPPPAPEPYGYAGYSGASRLSYSQPVPPPPPPSVPYPVAPSPPPFATATRPDSLVPGRRGTGSPAPSSVVPFQSSAVQIPAPPVVPPPLPPVASNSPEGLTVRCTFIPSMADELSITTGETIQVVQEYDDGWALCLNARGQRGMVPMECLDVGSTAAGDKPGLKRSSSLSEKS